MAPLINALLYLTLIVAISALVLAQKVWDDTPLINADFSILYPALTVKEINFLERKFLDLLEFKVCITPYITTLHPKPFGNH
jgi:hypothetical protein